MRLLNVIVQNDSFEYRDNNFVLTYEVADHVKDPVANLRSAIQEYGRTEQGKRDTAYACGYYNWGDAACAAMDEILAKYGLTSLDKGTVDIFVNHDEILIDGDDEAEDDS